MTETVCEPKDMAWIEKGVLGIEWNDGHKAVYPVRYLRQQCPLYRGEDRRLDGVQRGIVDGKIHRDWPQASLLKLFSNSSQRR